MAHSNPFTIIGYITVAVIVLWCVYKVIRLVLDIGWLSVLLAPLYLLGVLISQRFRNKHHRN